MQAQTIRQIPATDPATYALEITGEVSAAGMEAMADTMNAAFDAHDKVSMLIVFRDFAGSEAGAGLDWASIKSRFRSLTNLDKYVVVGAPDSAASMIEAIGAVLPVDARTFDRSRLDEAWAYLGTRPA